MSEKIIQSFHLFSTLFIASFIALFTLLSKKMNLEFILKSRLLCLFLILSLMMGVVYKLFNCTFPHHPLYDILPISIFILILISIFIISIYTDPENIINVAMFLLTSFLIFIVGYSLVGGIYWYLELQKPLTLTFLVS